MKRSGGPPGFEGASKKKRSAVDPWGITEPSPLAQKALASLQEVLRSMNVEARRTAIEALPSKVHEALLAFMETGAMPSGPWQTPPAPCLAPPPRTPAARKVCAKAQAPG